MGREGAVHAHSGILLSHKKDGIMPSAATQLEIIIKRERRPKGER